LVMGKCILRSRTSIRGGAEFASEGGFGVICSIAFLTFGAILGVTNNRQSPQHVREQHCIARRVLSDS
jgi:hypothetical protein